ncbi:MAG: NAD(P)/FAD-dependent oxidoreductase [Solirubrobacteraceae bacterium]
MTSSGSTSTVFRVVIAGAGVAGLEAALALRELGGERFDVTLIAPDAEFVYRPMTVREPFAFADAERYEISDIAQDIGVKLLVDSFAWVDPEQRLAHTEGGERIHYDALILALGARPHARYRHGLTIDDRRLDEQLHGLIQDIEGGYVHDLAFIVPPRMGWPLPIYELALMSARRAYDMNIKLKVTIATPEEAPLAIFGDGASSAVSELLTDSAITTICSADCEILDSRRVVINDGDRGFEVDRIVALPELFGPAVRGLTAGEHGLIPIDEHCRVRGVERIYAAGDATDYALKHGGIAAQQADTAVQAIAAFAGLPVEAMPFHPEIHGILLTGAAPRYLSARVIGGRGFSSEITDTPTWSPATKIAAKYLAPYLDARDRDSGARP